MRLIEVLDLKQATYKVSISSVELMEKTSGILIIFE
jgi:hypothetical protein